MKVFDSFIFFNELDLLEMRLNILGDVVDTFVITESPFTVSGNEKPLYFESNRDRFAKWANKIHYNITETIPNDFSEYLEKKPYHTAYKDPDPYGTPYIQLPIRFQRAIYNRECSMYGIIDAGAQDDDFIITSDADEIVNPYLLEDLDWFDPENHYTCLQRAFYYKLNYLYEEDWMGSRISSLKTLKGTTVDFLRQQHQKSYKIEQGGWHFSFFGNADNFRLKIESYEHTENNTQQVRETAEEKIEKGIDPFGRAINIQTVPVDESYPEYIQQNQEKYADYIKPWK
tara:strand:- start:4504 stop:5361 length:858 start_codon:yes stop_codon:yes gene_type:complete